MLHVLYFACAFSSEITLIFIRILSDLPDWQLATRNDDDDDGLDVVVKMCQRKPILSIGRPIYCLRMFARVDASV